MTLKAILAAACLLGSLSSVQAVTVIYTATLSGPAEAPPNASPGLGTVQVIMDTILKTMRVQVTFSNLTGNTTAAHIHAATASPLTGTAGVATQTPSFVTFPTGVTSGAMDQTYDMTLASSYNAAYITANGGTTTTALTALTSALDTGRAYFNVHTSTFTGGEIRGFLAPVPEPGATLLAGLCGVGLMLRRRRE